MLDDLRTLVDDLVRDVVGRLGEAARDRAAGLAVVQYGKDRPRTRVTSAAATKAGDPPVVQLPLPSGWAAGASSALAIEQPVGHVPPCFLPRHLWAQIETPDGPIIGLPSEIAVGTTCRLTWSLPHVVDETEDTMPTADREAVAHYAAALLLDQAAALTSGDQSSTIHADAVDHDKAAPNYAERARTARKRYHDLLGIDPKRQQPAAVIVQPPLASTTGASRLLFRRSRG